MRSSAGRMFGVAAIGLAAWAMGSAGGAALAQTIDPTATTAPGATAPTDPAATSTSTTIATTSTEVADDGDGGKPWWRVVLIAPIAAGIGIGTPLAKRALRERGLAVD